MFPLLIGAIGAIGAVVSALKGGSWLADQASAAGSGASVGGKSSVTSQADAAATPFAAALAAQTAGQTVPGSPGVTAGITAVASNAAPSTSVMLPQPILPQHSTDFDVLARTNAGIVAYNHIGEHHGSHAGAFGMPATQS